jgi:hypothetical protein
MVDNPYKIQSANPFKQLGVSLFFGLIAATIAYKILDCAVAPHAHGAFKFVFFFTALAGGIVFLLTWTLYKKWADKKYRESLGPPTARKLPD